MSPIGPTSPHEDEVTPPAPGDAGETVTLAFVGWARSADRTRVASFEDRALRILVAHGGEVVFRGRQAGDDEGLPTEVHVLRLPSRAAYEAFLADDGRRRLREEYGEVFDRTVVVEVEQVAP